MVHGGFLSSRGKTSLAMTGPNKEIKEGLEQWIDERIRLAVSGLVHPFEKRIARLRQRVQDLQDRLHHVSHRMEKPLQKRGRKQGEKKGGKA
jgi:hypothetical protein